ncbi:hypothetical protein Aph01nite_43260 [Acrocarpospora phusangensis]|uniref:Uncharacterized protein n=1 Tax=Acrocarpospora phusangensis TaxID=1070424 RepID=A0A919QDM3_9ACTN|nr:MazG-like family protein [Acrocarpospora phusangensis]GIH26016.1 hypothetical protein Aph01nite_43260 [Acrocarpospora phusangensis]
MPEQTTALTCDHSFPIQPPHGSLAHPGPCRYCGLSHLIADMIGDFRDAGQALNDQAMDDHRDHAGELAACDEQPCATILALFRGYGSAPALGQRIAALVGWLDKSNPRTDHEIAMRILKVVEEAGEASSAYIGMTGQNPRKGVTHTAADVRAELLDVVVTALVAMASLMGPGEEHGIDRALAGHLAYLCERVGAAVTHG